MEEAGYSRKTRLAFDRSCVTYVQRYRRMRDKVKRVPLDPSERTRKPRPTKEVPFYTEEDLLKELGVIIDEESGDEAKQILGELDAEMWDSVDWGDDDEPEP